MCNARKTGSGRSPRRQALCFGLAVAALARFAAPAAAQLPTTDTAPPPPVAAPAQPFSMIDGNFLGQATTANQSSLQRAVLAQTRSANKAIRDWAHSATQDRMQLAQQLQILSRSSGLQIPEATSQGWNEASIRLQEKTGAEFDSTFLAQEAKALDRDLQLYKQELEGSHNAALRAYAQQTLPMLQSLRNQVPQLAAR